MSVFKVQKQLIIGWTKTVRCHMAYFDHPLGAKKMLKKLAKKEIGGPE